MNKTLAIFVHFSKLGKPCENAILYAQELAKYFDEVIISTNISFAVSNPKIAVLCFEKNAYDFGYFYQALQLVNAYDNYSMIGFFNDSNYIIKPLDKFIAFAFDAKADYVGITDCHEKRPDVELPDQYHIQSHAVLYKNLCVPALKTYFNKISFQSKYLDNFDETTIKDLRKNIIIEMEIMQSNYFASNGLRLKSCYETIELTQTLRKNLRHTVNPHVYLWNDLIIKTNYPFIKKKVYHDDFPNDLWIKKVTEIIDFGYAGEIVKRHGNPEFVKTIKK